MATITAKHGMQPLEVRAELADGIAASAPWGVALDGLLAAQLSDEHKANNPTNDPPLAELHHIDDLPLPLGRCETDHGLRHWTATCAYPNTDADEVDVHYWLSHVDHRHAEQTSRHLPAEISDRRGRYRARWMPLLVTPCRAVTWRAIGHRQEVMDLLQHVNAIGKKRGSGYGHVLNWSVEEVELDEWHASHSYPDGTLGRPTPAECLFGRDYVRTGGAGTAGLRPPYFHPSRQHPLLLPTMEPPGES